MLNENDLKKIRQYKLDALCAIILHEKRLARLITRIKFVDFLAIAVPILYIVPRFAAKGTEYHTIIEFIWEAIAALLMVLALWKITMHWDEDAKKHFHLLRKNQALRTNADQLLSNIEHIDSYKISIFIEKARELEADDSEILQGHNSESENQCVYRDALLRDNPGSREIYCPHCGSPTIVGWKKGSCPRCGGIPRNLLNTNTAI